MATSLNQAWSPNIPTSNAHECKSACSPNIPRTVRMEESTEQYIVCIACEGSSKDYFGCDCTLCDGAGRFQVAPASPPESSVQFGAWRLDLRADAALATAMVNGEAVSVGLKEGSLVPWEGWWPMEPTAPKVIITGCCLWDGRWQCNCFGSSTKWRLGLTSDRQQAFGKLDKGKVLKKIFIPSGLGRYHLDLVRWQSEQVKRLRPKEVIYHIPVGEYHLFISELEMHLKIKLPELHQQLETFAATLRNMVEAQLGPHVRELQFFSPENIEDPTESYLEPYLRARDLGEYGQVAALEDLAELRLAHTAAQRQHRPPIPVFCCVLGLPHPYHRKGLVDGEFLEVSVPSAACPAA